MMPVNLLSPLDYADQADGNRQDRWCGSTPESDLWRGCCCHSMNALDSWTDHKLREALEKAGETIQGLGDGGGLEYEADTL